MNEETQLTTGNVQVVIQENRVTLLVSTPSGATVTTTINRETGKVETSG